VRFAETSNPELLGAIRRFASHELGHRFSIEKRGVLDRDYIEITAANSTQLVQRLVKILPTREWLTNAQTEKSVTSLQIIEKL